MTILITGATGLVGERLLPRLLRAGHACRALVRAGKSVPESAQRIEGDLLQPDTLSEAVQGVDAVVHLAALFRTSDQDAIRRVNLDGTRHLIAAARRYAPTARLVMASTSTVYFNSSSGRPGREEDHVSPELAYPASKIAAEHELRASGLLHAILRLGFVYGEGDGHLESAAPLFKSMGWHPAQSLSMVHHRDVAAAVLLALQGDWDGRTLNIVDDAPTTVHAMSQAVGNPLPSSTDPVTQPWSGHADGSLARSLGFRASVRTLAQAVEEGLL